MDVAEIERRLDMWAERLAEIDAERDQIVEWRNALMRYAITHERMTRPAVEHHARLNRQRVYQIVPTDLRAEDYPQPRG